MKVKEIMESNKKIIIDKTTSEYKEEVKKMINFLKIWKPECSKDRKKIDESVLSLEERKKLDEEFLKLWDAFK